MTRAVKSVAGIYKLTSRIKELHHQATGLPIEGVKVTRLPLRESSVAGFVVCFVPDSGYKPHRAEHDGRKFYLRMGDSVPPAREIQVLNTRLQASNLSRRPAVRPGK